MSEEPGAHRRVPRGYVYADHIPYETPESLDDLRGRTTGVIQVAPPISTAPDPRYDLSDEAMVKHLYSAVVRDGNAQDQEALLHRATLMRLWPELNLPVRCRAIWESKFPALVVRAARTA
ncbi:hypothetical protein GCM10017772_33980 [Promicromonospora soli]|uniref:Uncharacterized protein n=2 Tax=Promicromonospora soli TaxID=2035533 RepID=A0A919G1I9_9MICO|nr:hypothetical protein GCM10017772_33980 [Promicromonospora soli]